MIQASEPGFSGGDGVAAQFGLNGRLDGAAQQDDPQRRVADLGAEGRRGDEFAGTDDGGGQHDPWTDTPKRGPESRGRRFRVLRLDGVGVR